MGYGPLPFAPADIDLIRRGLERRSSGSAAAAPVPILSRATRPRRAEMASEALEE
jgi:hypothetical protein